MPDRLYLFDTVTLSNFALTDAINLLVQRYQDRLLITSEVLDEIAEGIACGYTSLTEIEKFVDKKTFPYVILDSAERQIFHQLLRTLDSGEASCIAAATGRNGIVVTDDRVARTACEEREIRFTGTIGILKASCNDKLISPEEADKLLKQMEENGFYSPVKRISDIL